MSKPLRMEGLTVKFQRNRAGIDYRETTIWQAP